MKYALYAAKEALDDAGWHPETPEQQEMTGVCLGSGIGSLSEIYNTSIDLHQGVRESPFVSPNPSAKPQPTHSPAHQGAKKVSPLFVPKLLINLAAGHISIKHSLKGPTHAATTACTTGAHSIGDASRFIAFGDANLMLAGGAESCIHPLAFIGFERSRSLTTSFNDRPREASRPFDKHRSGFVIGEGAAVLVLEEMQHALARGARVYAELAGYGATSDAYHLTAPPPGGEGAYRAMKLALKNAGVRPKEVGYVNAHATSTPLGDAAENKAIKRLILGDEGWRTAGEVNISSTKGAVGHLLGAAGAVEGVFSVKAIEEGVLPPTLNLREVDGGEFDCNYVGKVKQERRVDAVLSNSFGFGGTNASLCFKRFDAGK